MAQRLKGITAQRQNYFTLSSSLNPLVPLRPCALAPLRPCALAPLRRCALAPLRPCAVAPLRLYALTPLRPCAFAPLRRCAVAPLCLPYHHLPHISLNPRADLNKIKTVPNLSRQLTDLPFHKFNIREL